MIFYYSLTDDAFVKLFFNTIPKRADLGFLRICINRALDQVENEVMEHIVTDQMIVYEEVLWPADEARDVTETKTSATGSGASRIVEK